MISRMWSRAKCWSIGWSGSWMPCWFRSRLRCWPEGGMIMAAGAGGSSEGRRSPGDTGFEVGEFEVGSSEGRRSPGDLGVGCEVGEFVLGSSEGR
eukprot:scaffold4669_cov156-Cylindrotheca_fusiformis.AAC.1